VIPAIACNSRSWKWWPGTESNHRHADFQYDGEPGSARASRRQGRVFAWADRTARPTEPIPNRNPEIPTEAGGARSGSTACGHRDRTLSEPLSVRRRQRRRLSRGLGRFWSTVARPAGLLPTQSGRSCRQTADARRPGMEPSGRLTSWNRERSPQGARPQAPNSYIRRLFVL